MRRVGAVDYELELPTSSRIHNYFYVSCLKKALGQHIAPSVDLPTLDDVGKLILVLEAIVDIQAKKLRDKTITKYLVCWKDLLAEDAS